MNRWTKLWDRLFHKQPSPAETLGDILANVDNREFFLGVKRIAPPTRDKVDSDASRMMAYSKSQDYAVWSSEVWSQVLESMDKILDAKSGTEEINFHRGALYRALEILRISYKAKNFKETNQIFASVNGVKKN